MNKILTLLTLTLIFNLQTFSQTEIVLGAAFSDGLEKYIHFDKVDSIIEMNYKASLTNNEIAKGYEDYGKAKTIVTYDKKGIVKELSVYISKDKKGNTYQYDYDKNDRLIKRIVLNSESDTVHKIVIDYQAHDLIEKSVFFDGQTTPTTKWIFYFNDKSVIEKRSFPADDKVYSNYELGENNELLKQTNDTYYWNYKYNDKGKLVDEEQYTILRIDDGNPIRPVYRNEYKYDDYLNVIWIKKTTSRSEKIIEFKYTFDEKNNWIKRIEFENDKPKLITERIIVYRE